ncbi:uncharacterized protein TNCV_543841 [Trichonephila clavipes]|nr:uncharacterized protein TNCV_543841 [Trichonephila clavipes]
MFLTDIYKEYAITVILNKEESELEFIEFRLPDEEGEEGEEEGWSPPFADAHVVVYSVTSKRSFQRALDVLTRIQRLFRRSAVLLVGNKSDLVRVRAVTADESWGRCEAAPFILRTAPSSFDLLFGNVWAKNDFPARDTMNLEENYLARSLALVLVSDADCCAVGPGFESRG